MNYKSGEIVLIKFPYTNLMNSKKRPVLIIKADNELGDFVCFQITSQSKAKNIVKIEEKDFENKQLKLTSFVKYDKCFTLNSEIVEKSLSSVNKNFLKNLQKLFCDETFL